MKGEKAGEEKRKVIRKRKVGGKRKMMGTIKRKRKVKGRSRRTEILKYMEM